jgi:hypothetical protein
MPTTLSDVTWHGWSAIRLADAAVSVVVVPELGGRVVSLRDERSGRQWLMQGRPPDPDEARTWRREDAVFAGRVSFGWDECLPTVAPCDDPLDADAPQLRDHGDLWGRPTEVRSDPGAITTTWTPPRWAYRFTRGLSLEPGGIVRADYELVSCMDRPAPVLWSMHPTVALEPGSTIELPGVDQVRLTWTTGSSLAAADVIGWPMPTPPSVVDLGRVRAADGSAAKLYASGAAVGRFRAVDGDVLEVTWDRSLIPALGVWLDYGGWPPVGPPVEQVALEPTSSPDDDLGDAIAHDRAWSLPGNGVLRWWVRLTCVPHPG